MEILRRSAAPVTSEAWEEMDEQAKQILTNTAIHKQIPKAIIFFIFILFFIHIK